MTMRLRAGGNDGRRDDDRTPYGRPEANSRGHNSPAGGELIAHDGKVIDPNPPPSTQTDEKASHSAGSAARTRDFIARNSRHANDCIRMASRFMIPSRE